MGNKVTENFGYNEFLVSDSFPDLAAEMTLNDYERSVIKLACESVLQPLRDKFGKLTIESGKRSPLLNSKVGGASTSDHLYCSGFDIKPVKPDGTDYPYKELRERLNKIFNYIFISDLQFRQVITYDDQTIIHISINIPGRPYKCEALSKENGEYKYV